MTRPINNYWLGKKVREITNTGGFKSEIHEDVVPVVCVNPSDGGAEVQPSFTKPSVNQELLTYYFLKANESTSTEENICTPDATYDYYFVSVVFYGGAAGCGLRLGDQTSGEVSQTHGNTATFYDVGVGAESNLSYSPTLPLKIINALRASYVTPASGTVRGVIYYIRERKRGYI